MPQRQHVAAALVARAHTAQAGSRASRGLASLAIVATKGERIKQDVSANIRPEPFHIRPGNKCVSQS